MAISLILACAALDAALRGPWLDEFWTLALADRSRGLAALIRDGWLRDTHPPLFNAWATLLASLGVTSIPDGRLATNLFAAGLLLLMAWRLARRATVPAGFAASFVLLVLSLPAVTDSFATYRSYFGLAASTAAFALVARHVAATETDLRWRRDAGLAVVAIVAGTASIALHFVGGLFGGLLCLVLVLSAWRRGLRRWAALLLAVGMLAALIIVASVLLQAPHWAVELDQSWIDTPFDEAVLIVVTLLGGTVLCNPVPLLGLWGGFGAFDCGERRFVFLVGSALVAGIDVILAAHLLHPIVVERYLIEAQVMACALLAVPAARLFRDRRLFGVLALAAVAAVALPMMRSGIRPMWNEGADTVARIVSQCPSTRVFAASGWSIGPAPETRAALREDPVFERAYRTLARERGFRVEFIGQNGSAHATPGPCPVVLWFEHTPNEAENDPVAAIREAGLSGLGGARLSVVRSPTGFIVRADRSESPLTATSSEPPARPATASDD